MFSFYGGIIIPSLMRLQRISYCWFLEKGIVKELEGFSSIVDSGNHLKLKLIPKSFRIKKPRISLQEAKIRNRSYRINLFLSTQLVKGRVPYSEKKILLARVPLLINGGTFLINGLNRVIVSQLVRSPGLYYRKKKNPKDMPHSINIISNRGSWIKFEIDEKHKLVVRVDTSKQISAYLFLRSLGLKDSQVWEGLYKTKDALDAFSLEEIFFPGSISRETCLIEVSRCLQAGGQNSPKGARQLLYSRLFDPQRYDLGIVGRTRVNTRLGSGCPANVHILTLKDIVMALNLLILAPKLNLPTDDIDHLGNRRIRAVGELLTNQIRIGLLRLGRHVKQTFHRGFLSKKKPLTKMLRVEPVNVSVREFFSSNPLSQFMDQTNPLAEITHTRKVSVLGSGGISRDRATTVIRNVHSSQYGRICPIETPEGPNVGLVGSLATYSRVNCFGFLESPVHKVIDGTILKQELPTYLDAFTEAQFLVAPGDTQITKNDCFTSEFIPARYSGRIVTAKSTCVSFVEVSPIQILAVGTSLVPFLEHNDGNRVLMGSNMQRQAVPLVYSHAPIVGTGLEAQVACESSTTVVSAVTGKVIHVCNKAITIRNVQGTITNYTLVTYLRSNQDTCFTQKPMVFLNEKVYAGQVIADGSATVGGELSVGQNIMIAYMPWKGYNFEDAFVISERLVHEDVYTSIHIEKFEVAISVTNTGPEEITREVPYIDDVALSKLDENGIAHLGQWVQDGDILVGKVTPKGEDDESAELKLVRAIFGQKEYDVENSSFVIEELTLGGRVINVRTRSQKTNRGNKNSSRRITKVQVSVAQLRRIQIGDKVSGRHGNKGVIAQVVPQHDMPYLPNGRPVDILLNPLGVPSRMNVGQLFDALLGFAADQLNIKLRVLPFDERCGKDSSRNLVNQKLEKIIHKKPWLFSSVYPGKLFLTDGQTGTAYKNPITVGHVYVLKLIHLVDDKIHARSTGPYSQVTQQPLAGRSSNGGQRLGEMEVWALEAYGAAYNLHELLTLKSDDVTGRYSLADSIAEGKRIPRPRMPESVNLLFRELQALCLDIAAYQLCSSEKLEKFLVLKTHKELKINVPRI
jgi:DNA-directed RNA polymerase subunit beta